MITLDIADNSDPDSRFSIPALRAFLFRAQASVPLTGEVAVLLTSDREIRRLNRTFRGKNKATDVLSFPAEPAVSGKSRQKSDTPAIAGDLAISIETAARQAKQFDHALSVELKILLLHGLLHLAGYDHEADEGEMAAREEQLRRRFRLPVSLIARAAAPKSRVSSSRRRRP
jgi:probable rRNA maturation factor